MVSFLTRILLIAGMCRKLILPPIKLGNGVSLPLPLPLQNIPLAAKTPTRDFFSSRLRNQNKRCAPSKHTQKRGRAFCGLPFLLSPGQKAGRIRGRTACYLE